jgi:ABC-type cobalamin/Fe3+-siderophores transport system ATPase subunit
MSDEVIVQIQDVVFSYDATTTLNGVRFDCRRGEFLGLIGPNGSGKTTLLRCINGLEAQRGQYCSCNQVSKMKLTEIAKVCSGVPTESPRGLQHQRRRLRLPGKVPPCGEGSGGSVKGREGG